MKKKAMSLQKNQAEIDKIVSKLWRVLHSCQDKAPFAWAQSGSQHTKDRDQATDRYVVLAMARIDELREGII